MSHHDRISQTPEGFIKRDQTPYPNCLHIQFKNLLWQLPQRNFYRFSQYVSHLASPEGFDKNRYTEEKTVLVMAGHLMMALLDYAEVLQLHHLIQQAEDALLRAEVPEGPSEEARWNWEEHLLNTIHQPSQN